MKYILSFAVLVVTGSTAFAKKSIPKEGVYILSPRDGATVGKTFNMKFGVIGKKIEPAGPIKKDSGHYHILINKGAMKSGAVIPADATHVHYGKGQIEADVTLKPGKYTLTLQLADGAHVSLGPHWAHTIEVRVK